MPYFQYVTRTNSPMTSTSPTDRPPPLQLLPSSQLAPQQPQQFLQRDMVSLGCPYKNNVLGEDAATNDSLLKKMFYLSLALTTSHILANIFWQFYVAAQYKRRHPYGEKGE